MRIFTSIREVFFPPLEVQIATELAHARISLLIAERNKEHADSDISMYRSRIIRLERRTREALESPEMA